MALRKILGGVVALGAIGVGVATLAGFIFWELRCTHPMLDVRFFRNPRFLAANGAITRAWLVTYSSASAGFVAATTSSSPASSTL